MAGLDMDAGTRGPAVDAALRSSRPGVFAAGNLLHGAETADVAALGGRHAAASAAAFVSTGHAWPDARVPIECEPPLRWIAPNVVVPGAGRAAARALRAPLERLRVAAADRDRAGRPDAVVGPASRAWCPAARRACRTRGRRRSTRAARSVSVRVAAPG